jgi:hypothetical protein
MPHRLFGVVGLGLWLAFRLGYRLLGVPLLISFMGGAGHTKL